MKLKTVIAKIEEEISIRQAEDFDNVGLLCGVYDRNVSGVLVCHDALENVVDEAVERNCNLIVCFHPIIFSGLKSLTGKNYDGSEVFTINVSDVEHVAFEHFPPKMDQVILENQIATLKKEVELDPCCDEKTSQLYDLNIRLQKNLKSCIRFKKMESFSS